MSKKPKQMSLILIFCSALLWRLELIIMELMQILSRADEQVLQSLISYPIFNLLKLLEPELIYPSKLREVLLAN
jgi:hypothetical protein